MSRPREDRPAERRDDAFVPRGAIAFVIVMVLFYGAVWFSFYLMMVGRP